MADGDGEKHGACYEVRGARIFDLMIEISLLVNWTTSSKYFSTPPYFSSNTKRNASMVSGLCVTFSKPLLETGIMQ